MNLSTPGELFNTFLQPITMNFLIGNIIVLKNKCDYDVIS